LALHVCPEQKLIGTSNLHM